ITNRILPSGLAKGVIDLGIKYQIGPVSSTIKINNAIALETFTPSVLGILSSRSRFESYQIFSTDERWVKVLNGERTARAQKASICNPDPDMVRNRRPEVSTRSHSTTKRPSRFNAKANAPSSAQ